MLGTLVEISLTGSNAELLHEAASAAFDAIANIHDLMSFHSADSDISRLNNSEVAIAIPVNPHTWKVIQLAQEISVESAGVFDITIGGQMMLRGELPNVIPKISECNGSRVASHRDIELLSDSRVRLRRPLAIDVGGIAKGYAVDCAVDVLRRMNVDSGCVNAGGDLRAFGKETVPVRVRDPAAPAMAGAIVQLDNCAVATSANYATSADTGSAGVVLDPRDGSPIPDGLSASVRASNCMVADALAKCVLIQQQDSASLLQHYNADGFILGACGVVLINGGSDWSVSDHAVLPDLRSPDDVEKVGVAMREDLLFELVGHGVFT